MPPPKHSRATVPALYVLTLVEGLVVLKVPDRLTDRETEGGEETSRSCKKGKKEKRDEWIMETRMRGGPICVVVRY